MAITTKKKYTGQQSTSVLGGKLRIEEGNNRMVIYDTAGNNELVVIDSNGMTFSDGTDRRIRVGSSPTDGRVGIWVSKPGEDVIDLLGA